MQIRIATHSAAPPGACCTPLETALDPRLFRALGDPSRVHILLCLLRCTEPQTVGAIAACCSIDLSVVSRHLALLRDAGVLAVQKRGREVLYAVRCAELAELLRQMADGIEACCPPATAAGKANASAASSPPRATRPPRPAHSRRRR